MENELFVIDDCGSLYGTFTKKELQIFLDEKGIQRADLGSLGTHIKKDAGYLNVRNIRPKEDFDLPF